MLKYREGISIADDFTTMKKACFLTLIAAEALTPMTSRGQSAGPVIGYYRVDVPAGQSAWVCGLVTMTEFQAQATSVAPGVPLADGTPTSVITQSAANWSAPFPLHYVEILSAGAAQGAVLDIVGSTATTVRVRGAISGTPVFCIRKHATLATIFKGLGGMVDFQDSLTLYNSDNSLSSYFPAGGGNWVAEDFFTPANDTVIYPGQGFILSSTPDTVITIGGGEVAYVKSGPTQVPVYRGQTNVVGPITPLVATSPADPLYGLTSTSTVAGGNLTLGSLGLTNSGLEEFVDSITLFLQGGELNPSGSYYVGLGTVYADDFFTPADDALLRNGAAVIISAESADRVWKQTPTYPGAGN